VARNCLERFCALALNRPPWLRINHSPTNMETLSDGESASARVRQAAWRSIRPTSYRPRQLKPMPLPFIIWASNPSRGMGRPYGGAAGVQGHPDPAPAGPRAPHLISRGATLGPETRGF